MSPGKYPSPCKFTFTSATAVWVALVCAVIGALVPIKVLSNSIWEALLYPDPGLDISR